MWLGVAVGGVVLMTACSSGAHPRLGVDSSSTGDSVPVATSVPRGASTLPADVAASTTVVAAATVEGSSGISGRVTKWPSCPAESDDAACSPEPLAARVSVSSSSGDVVATSETASDGSFRIALAPGNYVVDAEADGVMCAPVDVTVTSNSYADVTVTCDSGVR
jgi:Carboxypeptidase regulatory-like domain